MENLLVYATLKSKILDKKVLGYIPERKMARLMNFKEINTGDGYNTVIESPGDTVACDLLFVTMQDLKKLDRWEDRYKRAAITNKTDNETYYFYVMI